MSSAPKLDPANQSKASKPYQCFEVEITNNIAHLRLCRADRFNSMIPEFWYELPEIIRDIDDNAKARAIVISAEGRHFCAGMDLSVFSNIGDGMLEDKHDSQRDMLRRLHMMQTLPELQDALSCLEQCRMPVLMAIQGACVGGAMDFVSASDMRYCTKDAFFCIQEINIGMTADVGTFPRLPYLIPQGLVRELAYTGRRMQAEEALQAGFVNAVFETQSDMLDHVMGIARSVAEKSPLAIWGSKEMINHARGRTIQEGLDHITAWQIGMFNPADMKESFIAKQEKRTPSFNNLPKKPKPI